MEKRSGWPQALTWAVCLTVLILDAKTAANAGKEAIELCLQVLIPSLLPFIFFSRLLLQAMDGSASRIARPVERLLRLPRHSGQVLLIGLLGGYPVGAATVEAQVLSGRLDKDTGKRMVLLCNQAGPAFIFGVGAVLFTTPYATAIVWAVQLLSVTIMAQLLPGGGGKMTTGEPGRPLSMQQVLLQSVKTMAMICFWVVLLRIALAFLDKWALMYLPDWLRSAVAGVLELSNGAAGLVDIGGEGLRLVLFCAMLSFGGLCVWQQTVAVAPGLVTAWYLPVRVSQAAISTIAAYLAQPLLPAHMRLNLPIKALVGFIFLAIIPIACMKWSKKRWKFQARCSIIRAKEGSV